MARRSQSPGVSTGIRPPTPHPGRSPTGHLPFASGLNMYSRVQTQRAQGTFGPVGSVEGVCAVELGLQMEHDAHLPGETARDESGQ